MNRDGGGRAMADQQRQPPRRRRRRPVGLVKLSLRLLLVVAVVLLDAGHAVPVASTASQDVADPHTGVRGIVMRLLGEEKGQAFLDRVAFESMPAPPDGNDVFELASPEDDGGGGGEGGATTPAIVVTIRGSSPLALAAGLGWYLRHYCKAFPGSWGNRVVDGRATGRQLETVDPARLRRVVPAFRRHAAVRWRYYMNVCTASYSMAWWDWARWEEELDWMALSGVNLALAFTGQEYIWAQLFEAYGVARDDLLGGWFTGPAFAAWQRMGNIEKWGGPLSFRGFVEPQHQLQLRILARMNLLGITPVLPAFAGFLPPAFVARLPANVSVTRLPDWNGFARFNMSGVFLLDPADPLFPEIGRRFVELQQAAYGPADAVTHFYSADTYNEMDPRTSDPAYLRQASAGVINGIRAADPAALWVMQGWLFHSEFWTGEAIAAYLGGVPRDALLVLDLNANVKPVWPEMVANDRPFVWNLLHNYGGRRALYGNLPAMAAQPGLDWAAAGQWMAGMGLTMEAIEHNAVVFELMLEMAWRLRDLADQPLDLYAWVGQYAERRYGTTDPRAKQAWGLLLDGVYSIGEEASYALLSPIAREPRLGLECERLTDTAALAEAWGLLLAVAADAPNATAVALSPLGYDLVDVTRQALTDAFVESLDAFEAAFDEIMKDRAAAALRGGNKAARRPGGGSGPLRVFVDACPREGAAPPMARLECLGARLLRIVDDTDAILGSNVNFLLGRWIADARAWGASPEEADLLEFNARNQVTLWGPAGNINDYASKQWAGLTSGYHRVRWSLFVAQVLATAADPAVLSFDEQVYHDAVLRFGQAFGRETQRDVQYPTRPVGDTVAIARRLHRAYLGAGRTAGGGQ